MSLIEWLFWVSGVLVIYAYVGYPLTLAGIARLIGSRDRQLDSGPELPTVSMIVPVHDERATIEAKLANVQSLAYPPDRFELIVVCDGCTDGTPEVVSPFAGDRTVLVELASRAGKAAALNAGLAMARHDIVVFSDASIMLRADALQAIVEPFRRAEVGVVSGADSIPGSGGESLYGRYELSIREQESKIHSIVGASGSFYAQRRALCDPFVPNLAPDFVSVLRAVERGFRAVSAPDACGTMAATAETRDEFRRKTRTLLRGMTTLGRYWRLLNPFAFGLFAFELWCHKLLRWLVPFLLAALLVSNVSLIGAGRIYAVTLLLQVVFYGLALVGVTSRGGLAASLPVRVSLYFTTANAAALVAWIKYVVGVRQEVWSPTRR